MFVRDIEKIINFALAKESCGKRKVSIMNRIIVLLACMLLALGTGMTQVSCSQSATDRSADVDGHHFVDLHLPSGLLWAETNLGASSATDPGYQYAWGETQVKKDYSQGTYRYGTDFEKMTKYNVTDKKTTLSASDDVATSLWGKACRMPTFQELEELEDSANCVWTWVERTTAQGDTIRGYEVKSVRNANSIFLPASGAHNGKNYYSEGMDGLYWTSTLAPRADGEAYCLYFNIGHYSYYMNDRSIGASVRAVAKAKY